MWRRALCRSRACPSASSPKDRYSIRLPPACEHRRPWEEEEEYCAAAALALPAPQSAALARLELVLPEVVWLEVVRLQVVLLGLLEAVLPEASAAARCPSRPRKDKKDRDTISRLTNCSRTPHEF